MADKLDNCKVQTTVGSGYDAMIKRLAKLKGITDSAMYREAIMTYCSFKYADELDLLQSKNNGS